MNDLGQYRTTRRERANAHAMQLGHSEREERSGRIISGPRGRNRGKFPGTQLRDGFSHLQQVEFLE